MTDYIAPWGLVHTSLNLLASTIHLPPMSTSYYRLKGDVTGSPLAAPGGGSGDLGTTPASVLHRSIYMGSENMVLPGGERSKPSHLLIEPVCRVQLMRVLFLGA